jgi:hypothetical protein
MPTIKKKRCKFCYAWFTPDARTAHQVCCGQPECRIQRKQAANKEWQLKNPDYDKTRAGKKRAWARSCGYWLRYRKGHPDYVAADSKRRSKAYKACKISANQDARRNIAVERLASTRVIIPNPSANQDAIARRVDIIAEYLFPGAPSANPNGTDQRRPGEP